MPKRILTVGLSLASENVEYADFASKTSLLDWDIVLFKPFIDDFLTHEYGFSECQGKICLNDRQSFRLREACEHWRREIKEAVESGKTVLVFLGEPQEVFIATGTQDVSGTGRNQKITRHVSPHTSYAAIPISSTWTVTQGDSMTLNLSSQEFLIQYWKRFEAMSSYNVVWEKDVKGVCISTKHGGRPVSFLIRSKNSNGSLLLLPDINFNHSEYF